MPDMVELSYRYAKPPDAPAIRTLVERCYRGDAARAGWTSEADILEGPRTSETEIGDLIITPGHYFVLGEDADGRLVATGLLERRGQDGYFGMLAIDPVAQGTGIGRQFLARLEQSARELWRSKKMSLIVISLRTELIAWYERRGYTRTGKVHPFPFSPTSGERQRDFNLIEMAKPL